MRYKEEVIFCENGEELEQVAQRSYGSTEELKIRLDGYLAKRN